MTILPEAYQQFGTFHSELCVDEQVMISYCGKALF